MSLKKNSQLKKTYSRKGLFLYQDQEKAKKKGNRKSKKTKKQTKLTFVQYYYFFSILTLHRIVLVTNILLNKITETQFLIFSCLIIIFGAAKVLIYWYIRSFLYKKNPPTQVRHLIWVRSWQNGVFHFVKTDRLHILIRMDSSHPS